MIEVYKFTSDTCAPCKILSTILEGVENITEITNKSDIQKFQKFGVRKVPTLIFFKDEKEVHRVTGVITRQEYDDIINNLNQ